MIDSAVLIFIAVLVAIDLIVTCYDGQAASKVRILVLYELQSLGTTLRLQLSVLRQILRKEEKIIMEIDDLKAAVAAIQGQDAAITAGITAAVEELQSLQSQLKAITLQETIDPHDVENAAVSIQTVATHLGAAVAALAAAAPAPAAPVATDPAAPATPAPTPAT